MFPNFSDKEHSPEFPTMSENKFCRKISTTDYEIIKWDLQKKNNPSNLNFGNISQST